VQVAPRREAGWPDVPEPLRTPSRATPWRSPLPAHPP
jgi:hypothetical protein